MNSNIIESGLHQQLKELTKYYMASIWNPKRETIDTRIHALGVNQLASIFYFYMIGIFVGFVAFIVEICYFKLQVLYLRMRQPTIFLQ